VSGGASGSTRSRALLRAMASIALGAIIVAGVFLNLSNVAGLPPFLTYAIVGSLLVIRQHRHLIGWLLLALAAGFSIVGRGPQITEALIATGWAPWRPMLAWIGTMAAIGLFAGMALLSAVFPTGALPGGGIGRMTRVGLALIAGVGLLQAVDPAFSVPMPDGTTIVMYNPIGIAPDWPGWSLLDGPAYIVVLGGLTICVVGLLQRFRRAGGIERQQFKWLLASAGRLRDQLDLDALGIELTNAAVGAVEPAAATFWLRRRTAVR
jgi:hypothetical protein